MVCENLRVRYCTHFSLTFTDPFQYDIALSNLQQLCTNLSCRYDDLERKVEQSLQNQNMILDTISNFPPPLPPPLPNPFTASQPSQLYQVNPLFQPSQPNPPSQSSSQPSQPNPPSQPLATPEPHPSQPNPPSAPPEPHPSQPLAPPEPYPSQPIPPSQPSQLHQLSQPLAVPEDTIRKYPKLTVLSKVSTLAVKLARESYFGAEVLKGSTVAGCREYLPLSKNKLNEVIPAATVSRILGKPY